MISLELAQKLKNAGLQWEPKPGDWYHARLWKPMLIAYQSTIAQYIQVTDTENEHLPHTRTATIAELLKENDVWLPRLDQLLAEIEARGYLWNLNKFRCCIISEVDYNNKNWKAEKEFKDNPSHEDAAARALLWILEVTTDASTT